MTAPVLEIFDNSHDIQHEVHINANAKALGAVLLENCTIVASFYPVAYFLWNLNHAW